ncbi:pectate lyase-like adhesive domain-containing protein [Anaerosphaera multitolerans]|nr:pectate lyase-like adhesive domain-containing protein [Anaerosphaera multitolerans]
MNNNAIKRVIGFLLAFIVVCIYILPISTSLAKDAAEDISGQIKSTKVLEENLMDENIDLVNSENVESKEVIKLNETEEINENFSEADNLNEVKKTPTKSSEDNQGNSKETFNKEFFDEDVFLNKESIAEVTDFQELKASIADSSIKSINIVGDITIEEPLIIEHSVLIEGNNNTFIGNAAENEFMFKIKNREASVTFSNVEFNGNNNGAIYSETDLSLRHCSFKKHKIEGGVGGSFNSGVITIFGDYKNADEVNLLIEESIFFENSNGSGGTALNIEGYVCTEINNSEFNNNNNSNWGGTIFIQTSGDSNSYSSFKLANSYIENNIIGSQGAPIYISGRVNMNVDNVALKSNTTNGTMFTSGGIYYSGWTKAPGKVEIKNSVFENNRPGAASINSHGETLIENSKFINNQNDDNGGALYLSPQRESDHNVKIIDSTFTGNSSKAHGGAVYGTTVKAENSIDNELNIEIINTLFDNNTAGTEYGDGGAICVYTPRNGPSNSKVYGKINLNISENSKFTGNSSKAHGGAISAESLNVDPKISINIKETEFIGNSTKYYGGAIQVDGIKKLEVSESNFDKNKVSDFGGGAINVNDSTRLQGSTEPSKVEVYIRGSSFKENSSNAHGGAILVDATKTMEVSGTEFKGNKANLSGGAINFLESIENGFINLDNNVFTKNTAVKNGGAINLLPSEDRKTSDDDFIYYEPVTIKNTKFSENISGRGFYYLDEAKYPKIQGVYNTNVENVNQLSGDKTINYPTGVKYNKAYNNYDVSFVGGLIVVYDGNGYNSGEVPVDDKIYEVKDIVNVLGKNTVNREGYNS